MKKHMPRLLTAVLLLLCTMSLNIPVAFAETAASYNSVPTFVTRGSDSNVLLNLSIESPMQGAAYNDQPNDINGDGDTIDIGECSGRVNDNGTTLGRCYFASQDYLGIFDPNKAYDVVAGRFVPVGATNEDHSTSGHYSGNFLNWATMTAIDEFRWALTGGRRTTDTTTETVIERANMGLSKNNDWFRYKRIRNTDNVHPNTVTPFTNTTIYIYNHGYQVDIGTSPGGYQLVRNLNVRAKVCDPTIGLEDNCVSYNNGAYYKPEGLIQNNADRMRFAVMSYALDNDQSRGGGVLRANMKYVGPALPDGTTNTKMEYGTNGIYIDNPNPEYGATNSGVINYVNKFGANGYKSYDPVSELFYECLNYFKHRGRTPEYANGLTTSELDGFPAITDWDDPIEDWCQPNFIVGINDANPWLDKKLPGTYFTATPFHGQPLEGNDYGEPGNADTDYSVRTLTNTVGALEGLNGTLQRIGCTAANCDDNAGNSKIIPGLGEVMGTSPAGQKENSYYVAGLAYYAHTQDIRSDLQGRQTVSTFMIDTQEYNANPLVGQMNMLWLTGKYGGFEENDSLDTNGDGNVYEPNLTEEWDADSDGSPDNYVLATDPSKLINGLVKVFNDISKKSASATVASVISGSRSGEGAVYQSVFYPQYSDNAVPLNTIEWVGSLHASFVDASGRMREDTNQNRILDIEDKILTYRRDPLTNVLSVDKFLIDEAEIEETRVTVSEATSLAAKYFVLNTVGEQFYVWFTVDGNGANPKPAEHMTGISVALDATDSANMVAIKTAATLDAYGAFTVPDPVTNFILITNTTPGDVIDATSGTAGFPIAVLQQGAGETDHLDFTGEAEDIDYLWNSNTWLNTISDADIVRQRTYADNEHKRYIFTFVDADQNKVAGFGEQVDFLATNLPDIADLSNSAKIYPYIPVSSDSEKLPPYVSIAGGNRDEFLQKQTQRVINYTRGLDQGSATLSSGTGGIIPAFRSRKLDLDNNGILETTWRLGDIVHSSPTVVDKPKEAFHLLYKDTTYATFAAKYQQRRTVIYTGANDGMLHAFNGGFHEDRFDVFPAAGDNERDLEFLLQPKTSTGITIAAGFAAHPLGAELWAYVPYNLLPHLYWPTEQNYGHVYYADLKPRIFDAKIFTPNEDHPGGWGTVLVGGMRFGGGKINVDMNRSDGTVDTDDRTMSSAFFILDVTNPEKPPVVLGELSFPNLGYTTCYPTVAAIKDKVETATSPNNWYLVFGSGPAESDGSPGTNLGVSLPLAISNQKAKLYVVDLVELATNKVLKTIDPTGALSSASPYYYQSFDSDTNAFISDPITVDFDLDYKADVVYFGTESYALTGLPLNPIWGGKLRRIVMDDDSAMTSWDGDSVLVDLESVQHQPISAAPTVGLDPSGNYWVYFGTGRYFARDDAQIFDQQTFYGIKEPRSALDPLQPTILSNDYSEVFLSDLYESTLIEVKSSNGLVTGGTAPNIWAGESWRQFLTETQAFGGWYYNFTDILERNVGQGALFGDLLTFTTYVPSSDICEYEGYSYIYALYYLTGTAPDSQVISSTGNPTPENNLKRLTLGPGLTPKPSIHPSEDGGSDVFVQTSDGAILTYKEENPAETKAGRTAWGYK